MVANNNSRFYICPVCGQKKRTRDNDLVCSDCYKRYVQEAGRALIQGSVLSLTQWALPKTEGLLEKSQEQLQQKQKAFKDLQKQVSNEAYEEVKKGTGGKFVVKEIFSTALDLKKAELWKEKGGNRLFAEMKVLEEQVSFIQGVIEGIQKRNNHPSPAEVKDDSVAKPQ